MVQIIVATHGGLARELVHTTQLIVGAQKGLIPVCLELHEGIEDLKGKLQRCLEQPAEGTEGHLVLVDMFGGTPSNVALEMSQNHPLRVLTGVNLPMLLESLTHRSLMDVVELAEFIAKRGKQSIFNASELFAPRRVPPGEG